MEIENIGREKMPSILQDPFKKNHVTRIYVNYSKGWGSSNKWTANGSVEFENGQTNGEQKFTGSSFDEVVQKMKAFIETELK